MVKHLCPVCNYPMHDPPEDFNYCPCCGTQFGYHDVSRSYSSLLNSWINNGMKWWSPVVKPPSGWNPNQQVAALKLVPPAR